MPARLGFWLISFIELDIKKIDRAIEKTVTRFEEVFNHDGKTTYVFTADHGMSDRGNHGDGERANTETPLVIWGAGVSNPQPVSVPTVYYQDTPIEKIRVQHPSRPTPEEWDLQKLARFDIEQGDLAPLMASFIGAPFPVNNVGILPTLYIDKAEVNLTVSALYTNAEQIFRQMERKSAMKQAHTLFFTEFPEMASARSQLSHLRKISASSRQNLGAVERYEELAKESIATSLRGMHYFQVYDWPFLMTVVTLGYVGWIVFVAVIIVTYFSTNTESVRFSQRLFGSFKIADPAYPFQPQFQLPISPMRYYFSAVFATALAAFLFHDESPLSYYAYAAFPIGFWTFIFTNGMPALRYAWSYVCDSGAQRVDFIAVLGGCFAAAQILVLSFFYRETISIIFTAVALWGLFMWGGSKGVSLKLRIAWAAVSLALSVFPTMPISMGESYFLVYVRTRTLTFLICSFSQVWWRTTACLPWIPLFQAPFRPSLVRHSLCLEACQGGRGRGRQCSPAS